MTTTNLAPTSVDEIEIGRDKMSQAELDQVLESHEAYLKHRAGGVRANLKLRDLSFLNFSGRDLSEADLSGSKLYGSQLVRTKLQNAILFAADLRSANLEHAELRRADLRGACLRGACMNDAIFVEADLRGGVMLRPDKGGELKQLTFMEGSAELSAASAQRADMSRAKMSNAFILQTDLTDSILCNVRFVKANLSNSNLTGASLEGADLTEANLSGAILQGAVMSRACLMHTNLRDADLIGAILDFVDLSSADLSNTLVAKRLEQLDGSLRDILAAHVAWIDSSGHAGKRADLSKHDLSGQDFSGLNLSAANLAYTILKGVNFSKTALVMADLSFADMRDIDISYADLRGGQPDPSHSQRRQTDQCPAGTGGDFRLNHRVSLDGKFGKRAPEPLRTGRGGPALGPPDPSRPDAGRFTRSRHAQGGAQRGQHDPCRFARRQARRRRNARYHRIRNRVAPPCQTNLKTRPWALAPASRRRWKI